jgi:hypothetical protein
MNGDDKNNDDNADRDTGMKRSTFSASEASSSIPNEFPIEQGLALSSASHAPPEETQDWMQMPRQDSELLKTPEPFASRNSAFAMFR